MLYKTQVMNHQLSNFLTFFFASPAASMVKSNSSSSSMGAFVPRERKPQRQAQQSWQNKL